MKAIVTPEHKISKKGYGVTVTCNEEDEVVLSALCDSCAASLGDYIGILLSWFKLYVFSIKASKYLATAFFIALNMIVLN